MTRELQIAPRIHPPRHIFKLSWRSRSNARARGPSHQARAPRPPAGARRARWRHRCIGFTWHGCNTSGCHACPRRGFLTLTWTSTSRGRGLCPSITCISPSSTNTLITESSMWSSGRPRVNHRM